MDPISGTLMVEASAVPIASIDIQLLRVESILVGDRISSDISVVQTTQARPDNYLNFLKANYIFAKNINILLIYLLGCRWRCS